jgi:hypothetical protein
MSTWGVGNFEDDRALDFAEGLANRLLRDVEIYFATPPLRELDFDIINSLIMPTIDIVSLLCATYEIIPNIEHDTLVLWQKKIIQFCDSEIATYSSKENYHLNRRAVIQETFSKLIHSMT